MRWLVAFALVMGVACRREPTVRETPDTPPVKINPAKPEEALYEQLRAGFTQIDGVVGTLDTVTVQLKAITAGKDAELKQALADVAEAVDASGAALGDFADGSPEKAEVGKHFGEFDDQRIKAIAAANDARHDLIDAQGIADSLAEPKHLKALSDIADLLEVAIEDLKDAIQSLGGQVEEAS